MGHLLIFELISSKKLKTNALAALLEIDTGRISSNWIDGLNDTGTLGVPRCRGNNVGGGGGCGVQD